MSEMVVITPEDVMDGFALAGVTQVVTTAENVEAELRRQLSAAVGVVAVDERLLAKVPAATLQALERRWYGVLLVLPAPGAAAGDYLAQLVRRTLGYQVRLRS